MAIGDISKVFDAGKLLVEFCRDTDCKICPIRKECKRRSLENAAIGKRLIEIASEVEFKRMREEKLGHV